MNRLPESFLNRPLAHRGLHNHSEGIPENSLAAIKAAIHKGYGVEIDLQLSADGRAMVFHDGEMERMTGMQGCIREWTAKRLNGIYLNGGCEQIPAFAEVLDIVQGQIPLLIELKDQHGMMGMTCGTLEQAVAAALEHYWGPTAVMSFNPNMIYLLSDIAPHLTCGLTTCSFNKPDWPAMEIKELDRLRNIADYDHSTVTFISHEASDLMSPRVAELKKAGAQILCWTVLTHEQEKVARNVAQNITFEGFLPDIPALFQA